VPQIFSFKPHAGMVSFLELLSKTMQQLISMAVSITALVYLLETPD
jgi:hypothetical protein